MQNSTEVIEFEKLVTWTDEDFRKTNNAFCLIAAAVVAGCVLTRTEEKMT
jgi:hypothetical protein